jgi:dihydropyrimidinase
MYTGVVNGHIGLTRWVEIVSTNPARMFGMFPKKGTIAPGSDADIVVFDPNRSHTISVANHAMDVDYSAYEGHVVPGTVDMVLLRGRVIVEQHRWLGALSDGAYVPRGLCDYLR